MKSTLVVIPARGGSKGIPGKNIKILGGKPLIQHTLDAARTVFPDDQIVVSTDDVNIKRVVDESDFCVNELRPMELAGDNTSMRDVLLYEVEKYQQRTGKLETLVLLQPTSPFRTAEHIIEAISLFEDDLDMVISVKETDSNPYYLLKEENAEGFLEPCKAGNFTARQECPPVYEINGAIYIINVETLLKSELSKFKNVKKYLMSKEDSIDLDDMIDWHVASALIKNRA